MTTTTLHGLSTAFLWLIAIDYGDGMAYLTYKTGKRFLVSVIHFN